MRILLIAYDNESYIHYFPQGLAYLAVVLEREGHDVEIYSQDKYHYPDEHLTQYLDENKFDVVGVGVIGGYYQYRRLIRISESVNKSKNRPFYMIGGHGPSPEPEFFLRKAQADVVAIGESEITVVKLMEAVAGHKSLAEVKGIAYWDGSKVVVNERQPLIEDLDSLPFPAYHLFPMDYYRLMRLPHTTNTDFVMPLLSSRGCKFNCNFCYRMDEGWRTRSNANVIDEIVFLKEKYGVTYIAFSGELLMASKEQVIRFCEDIIAAKLGVRWFCDGRLNFAVPKVLKLMKEAGCVFINYGIEAMDDQILKNMNKALTVKMIIKGIEATLEAGISPGFNIIFGNIGESKETLEKGVEFLLKYDDGAQMRTIRPVTPYPGSPLYYYAIEKGLLEDCEDFYEHKHVNSDLVSVNFTDMSDDEFHRSLLKANTRLLENYFERKLASAIQQSEELYLGKDASFRGFRQL